MSTEPILAALTLCVIVVVLFTALKPRIEDNDIKNQVDVDDYDENSYS